MSGRSHYRKTARRQSPPRRIPAAWPAPGAGEVVGSFMLPPALALIAPGRHGMVVVTPAGLVEVDGRSRDHVIRLAADFFARVARDRLPFTVSAQIGDRARPSSRDTYQLTVIEGHTVAARCALAPAVIHSLPGRRRGTR